METDKIEEICMQLITYAGVAKSSYVQAMYEKRNGKGENALKLLKEGQKAYSQCHKIHQKMFTEKYKLDDSMKTILLMHAEDQMMSCETIYIMASELIECYSRIEKLEEKK